MYSDTVGECTGILHVESEVNGQFLVCWNKRADRRNPAPVDVFTHKQVGRHFCRTFPYDIWIRDVKKGEQSSNASKIALS